MSIKYIFTLVVALIIITLFSIWYMLVYKSVFVNGNQSASVLVSQIALDAARGQEAVDKTFQQVIAKYDQNNFTDTEKSKIALISGDIYRNTGSNADAIRHIQMLKEVVLDPNQSIEEKAKRLNDLATLFCGFGRDVSTLREIFSGEPFEQFWVEGDGALSAKKMLEWSYQEFGKRPMSAIFLSRWYVNRSLVRNLDKQTVEENKKMALFYLRDADNLVKQELLKDKNFEWTHEYRMYYFWKTFIVTGLVELGSKDLTQFEIKTYTYKNLTDYYSDYIESYKVDTSTNQIFGLFPVAKILEAYFYYTKTKDQDGAKKMINEVMVNLNIDRKIISNTYVEFMSDSVNAGSEAGIVVKATIEMRKLYPEFDKFMSELVSRHLERKAQDKS